MERREAGWAVPCTPKQRRPQEWSPYLPCLVASSLRFLFPVTVPAFLVSWFFSLSASSVAKIIGCSQLTPFLADVYGIAIYGITSSGSRIEKGQR
jgi:hypothetical protein